MLLDSGLNLFDIMANLCSQLYCEVLLKSGNYVVYLSKWTSALHFNKRWLCKTDLSGLKLSLSIANPCSKINVYRSERSVSNYLEIRLLCVGLE